MQKIKPFLLGVLVLSLTTYLSSCKKKQDEEPVSYWWKVFFAGNFNINGEDLITYKDAYTTTQVADFVNKSEMPEGVYHNYSLRIYIPTDTNLYRTVLNNEAMEILADGRTMELIVDEVQYINIAVMDSVQYAVYQLNGADTSQLATSESFENFKVSVEIDYENLSGASVHDRKVIANIYKKNN